MGRTSNGRKPFRFLWNRSAALASNLYLLLFPKGPLQAALRSDPQIFRAVFEALREIDTAAFIREGRVYGGGLYKMEPKELGIGALGRAAGCGGDRHGSRRGRKCCLPMRERSEFRLSIWRDKTRRR